MPDARSVINQSLNKAHKVDRYTADALIKHVEVTVCASINNSGVIEARNLVDDELRSLWW